ncbi:hypothetical protein ACPCHQ_21790 [Ralstonia thomasii]|uniref:hypothetical protein n=1 Tax=Ralstonia thomasii TaxID=3058596 RepID=UPI003C2CFFFF
MKATISSWCGKKPIWRVEDDKNVYRVYQGAYTCERRTGPGAQFCQVSIMHARYAGLRARINAAIAASVVEDADEARRMVVSDAAEARYDRG